MKNTFKLAALLLAVVVIASGCKKEKENGTLNGHKYVDLGLPSGTLWAASNIGAETPEAYGDYFAWGETEPQTDNVYNWNSYKHANGDFNKLTKYCGVSDYGNNGFTDTLTCLLPEDDAATAQWGKGWRIPTKEELTELKNNCTATWTTQNGINGLMFTASNGNSVFLPAAGYRYDGSLNGEGGPGLYWTASLCAAYPSRVWNLGFGSGGPNITDEGRRCYGFAVRPVCSAPK